MILQALDELIEFVDADDEMSDRTKERCAEAVNKHRRQRWRQWGEHCASFLMGGLPISTQTITVDWALSNSPISLPPSLLFSFHSGLYSQSISFLFSFFNWRARDNLLGKNNNILISLLVMLAFSIHHLTTRTILT